MNDLSGNATKRFSGSWFRRLSDRLAGGVICAAGLAVVLALLAMLALIAAEAIPLFLPAKAFPAGDARLGESLAAKDVLALAADSDLHGRRYAAFVVAVDGRAGFVGNGESEPRLSPLPGAEKGLAKVEPQGGNRFSLLWKDGSLSHIEARFDFSEAGAAEPRGSVEVLAEDSPTPEGELPLFAMMRGGKESYAAIRVYASGRVVEKRLKPGKGLLAGKKKPVVSSREVALHPASALVSSALNGDGGRLCLGTSGGELLAVDFPDSGDADSTVVPASTEAITSLSFLAGGFAVAAGDAGGGASVWFPRRDGGAWRLRRSQVWPGKGDVGVAGEILASRRNRSFLVRDESGHARLLYSTTGRELLDFDLGPDCRYAAMNGRGDCLATLSADGTLEFRKIDNPFPEAGWRAFLGKILYEGRDAPAYIWQSTGGEGSEAKLSLVPVIWGTLKGSLYAMCFAVPLALAAAVYLSQLADPVWRGRIKPLIEMLAAVPSVVVGFLAALWLAPLLERYLLLPPLFLVMLLVAGLILLAVRRRYASSRRLAGLEGRHAFLFALPLAGLAFLAAWLVLPGLERAFFSGDFHAWLAGLAAREGGDIFRYDQRNALVIAVAMGFAVIPNIFSLAEDSLSTVPPSLSAASLALGASKWQTVIRVIVPSASPGIFTAVMLGLGRAVGETMIVLMAAGNTPLLSLSPFNGMRTLSANIAVEMPEAPVGETLYRTLFLCALVLFLLTFAVNSLAETVRVRLRRRYGRY